MLISYYFLSELQVLAMQKRTRKTIRAYMSNTSNQLSPIPDRLDHMYSWTSSSLQLDIGFSDNWASESGIYILSVKAPPKWPSNSRCKSMCFRKAFWLLHLISVVRWPRLLDVGDFSLYNLYPSLTADNTNCNWNVSNSSSYFKKYIFFCFTKSKTLSTIYFSPLIF